MKKIILIFLAFPLWVSSLEISRNKLNSLIASPPEWMVEQIKEELSLFQENGITLEMIERTVENVHNLPGAPFRARLVRFEIRNNQVSLHRYPIDYRYDVWDWLDDLRDRSYNTFFNFMKKYVNLPDVVFLASFWDFYDNPAYLAHTECPVFTISKLRTNHKAVLIPEAQLFQKREQRFREISKKLAEDRWENKIELVHWRGKTTGGDYSSEEWDFKPRSQLAIYAKNHPELIDAAFSTTTRDFPKRLSQLLHELDYFKEADEIDDWLKYKYLIAIDGNSFPSSYWWELLSNSVTLKAESDQVEWFYRELKPFVHYVPFESDCSDLEEKILWLQTHDEEAKQIAINATQFAKQNLSLESAIAYFYHLLNAYSKLQRM